MKIKDITISIFAIIGFVTILSSFNNQSQETHSTVPESHVWEMTTTSYSIVTLNKVTGEIRKHNLALQKGKDDNDYIVTREKKLN